MRPRERSGRTPRDSTSHRSCGPIENMPSQVYHHSVQIYYEDTDHSGVVYHPNFLKYFERAREHVLGAKVLVDLIERDGIGFAVYRADIKFSEGVRFGDVCDVRSTVTLDGKFRTVWQQELWRPGGRKAAVSAHIEMVTLDSQGNLTPLPAFILEALTAAQVTA
jgi:acyl-CoA thioester hydrolase